jgi:colicin import membrane protein
MARERLSWEKDKKAGQEKNADPYSMNQDHKNPPASKYDIGGPSQFAEDPDNKTPWKNEGRVETGHPAPIKEAVKAAQKLEDKALKCITIAQRILPGASDSIIEEQATDFMYLPDKCILATLQRQSELAEILAKDNGDDENDNGNDKKPEEKVDKAAKKEEKQSEEDDDAEKLAKEKAEKEAKEKAEKEEENNNKEKENGNNEEDVDKAAKKEEKKTADLEIELSNDSADLLDSVFANEEKGGARKLSGLVKKASTENRLDGLWNAPPDVSKAFDMR